MDEKIIDCIKYKDVTFKSGDINHSKIARQLNISYKTVIRRINKIRKRAKEMLKKQKN